LELSKKSRNLVSWDGVLVNRVGRWGGGVWGGGGGGGGGVY